MHFFMFIIFKDLWIFCRFWLNFLFIFIVQFGFFFLGFDLFAIAQVMLIVAALKLSLDLTLRAMKGGGGTICWLIFKMSNFPNFGTMFKWETMILNPIFCDKLILKPKLINMDWIIVYSTKINSKIRFQLYTRIKIEYYTRAHKPEGMGEGTGPPVIVQKLQKKGC